VEFQEDAGAFTFLVLIDGLPGLRRVQKDVKIDQYQLRLEQTYDPGKANYSTHSVWRLCYPLSGLQHQPALYSVYPE
jgi:hypothetical protein